MKVSEALGVSSAKLWKQGVFDSYLGIDSRLHIDPALHHRKSHEDDLTTVAFLLMGAEHFPAASLEIAYLADSKTWKPEMTKKKLGNRAELIQNNLTSIRAGKFHAERSTRTCPNCPALFVCGETPVGKIPKKVN